MIISVNAEIRTINGTHCRRTCDHLQWIAQYCLLFKRRLKFGYSHYRRCGKCLNAKKVEYADSN